LILGEAGKFQPLYSQPRPTGFCRAGLTFFVAFFVKKKKETEFEKQ